MTEQTSPDKHSYVQPQSYGYPPEDEINLREIWDIVRAEKWLIIAMTAVFAIGSVIYALLQTNIYRAETVLAPAESRQSSSPLATQLGGAAALVGINLGTPEGGRVGNTLAVLRSREFIRRFIHEHDVLIPLFAGTFDPATEQSDIDPEIYDISTGEWQLTGGQPTDAEAYRMFSSILRVNQTPTSDIVTVSIDWHDPIQAARWVNQMVSDLNRDIKAADVEEANNAIRYLRGQLETTQLVEMQRVFYELIESQTRITMLADVRDEYVFQIIDPAVVADQKIAPRRSMIAIVGTLMGAVLGLFLVFIRHQLTRKP